MAALGGLYDLIAQLLGVQGAEALTIAADAIAPTRGAATVDTEALATTDTLARIVTTNLPDGRWLLIRPAATGRQIQVQHLAGGAGQISLAGGAAYTLANTDMWLLLERSGAGWRELMRGPRLLGAGIEDDGAGTMRTTMGVNPQTGAYAIATTDRGKLVTIASATAVAVSLPAGQPHGWWCDLTNRGVGLVTINATVDGVVSPTLAKGQGVRLVTDGTAWYSQRGAAADGNVKVSATDTTAGPLNSALTAGAGVVLKVLNSGGDEQLQVTAASSYRNLLINGDMSVWQRGTSFVTGLYTADRWYLTGPVGITASRQASGLAGSPTTLRIQRAAGTTGSTVSVLSQIVESAVAVAAQGKSVTVSVQARAGANYSGALSFALRMGSGIDEGMAALQGSGWTGILDLWSSPAITTGWARYSATFAVPADKQELAMWISPTFTGTSGAADWVEITDVQIEAGTTASEFERLPPEVMLSRCQRYFETSYDPGVVPGTATLAGAYRTFAWSSAQPTAGAVRFAVPKRATPTVTIYSPGTGAAGLWREEDTAADLGSPGVVAGKGAIYLTNASNTFVSGRRYQAHWAANAEL